VHRHAYVSKTQKTDQSKSKPKTKTKEKKKKGNIYIIYKGSNQAKYLFRAWPFTG
jgi:hypothetical protein